MADISYKDLIAPSFYGLWNDIVQYKYPEIWLAGGRGCIDGDTLIDMPSGKCRVKDFKGGEVYSYEGGQIHLAKADAPQRHTVEDLFEVIDNAEHSIVVTDEHKFLTPQGWKMLKELDKGDVLLSPNKNGNGVEERTFEGCRFVKRDYYWDFNVQGTHNYVAQGFINHNSTKSSFASTAAVLLMEAEPRIHCVCFRKYAANLADSIYTQFEYTINEKLKPISDHWIFKRSPLKIVNGNTGQQILFRGLDDPQKIKSLKMPFGWPGITIFEELAEFDGIEEIRNVSQSLHRGGHRFLTLCAYNPPPSSASWVNAEAAIPQIVDGKLHRFVHHSDYRTVPREWLGENFFREAELLKATNERAYRHEYLGEATGNGGAVFPNVEAMTMTDAFIRTLESRRFALDFGFSLDPSAFVGLGYVKSQRAIYIFDEIYKVGLTNMDLAEQLNERKNEIGFNYVMCDSAEPKSIAELESFGVNVLPAQKGPDSIRFGIKWLQTLLKIYIDPVRCPNTFREFTQYEYEKNKAGLFLSKFPDYNNHSIDACLDGNTQVRTPYGDAKLSDLEGRSGMCYGFDQHSGSVKEVEFKNVRKTRTGAVVHRVTLENGDGFVCTPDHRVLVYSASDGAYVYKECGSLKMWDHVVTMQGGARVTGNRALPGVRDVYDMEVPQTHNFAVGQGAIVHNCRYAIMEDAIAAGLF